MSDDKEEKERLNELGAYGVLDSENEIEFDAIVREAAESYGTPIALISLIDENRQWFKAKIGLEPKETPRSISFCTHAIKGQQTFTVENAETDPRFSENPLVTGDPNISFYAGAPLKTPSGKRIGTLCVIDTKTRSDLTGERWAKLEGLAERVMDAFEKRRAKLASTKTNS